MNGDYGMRIAFLIIGVGAIVLGLLWIGQGTGVIAWHKTSFMFDQIRWAGYGALLAAAGLILISQTQR